MFVVDLFLKDDMGQLLDGVVFPTNEKGQESIQNKDEIEELLNGKYDGSDGRVCIQNRYANAYTHYTNIKSYKIKEAGKKELEKN